MFILPLSEIILIMYHLLPYNASDAPESSNGQSNNNHNPKHLSPGDDNLSDTPSDNYGICNDFNIVWLLPENKRNELYNVTT